MLIYCQARCYACYMCYVSRVAHKLYGKKLDLILSVWYCLYISSFPGWAELWAVVSPASLLPVVDDLPELDVSILTKYLRHLPVF